jgi:hypothetical protein
VDSVYNYRALKHVVSTVRIQVGLKSGLPALFWEKKAKKGGLACGHTVALITVGKYVGIESNRINHININRSSIGTTRHDVFAAVVR